MRIIIIGYGPATIKALEAIENYVEVNTKERPEVIVISSEKENAYGPMFLIKHITGQITERQLFLLPEDHEYPFPLKKFLGKRVVQVVEKDKTVVLEDGQEITFDKLLIASGASPIIPPIKGLNTKGVFYLSRIDDARKITRALENVSDVLIIGAGAMGMEAGIAFNRLGKHVKVIDLAGQVLPQTLGPKLAEYAKEKIEAQGIEFYLGEAVLEIKGIDIVEGVVTGGGKKIDGDMVLLTAGVRPNYDFVSSTSIKINRGIIVNDRMETSIPDVYAAGDVAETKNAYGDYELVFNWYSAISQGWIAGCNLMGQQKIYHFCPLLSVLKEVDFPIVSIGKKGNDSYEHLFHRDDRNGVMEEISLKDNHIDTYQAIGIKDKTGLMYSFIMNRKKVGGLKTDLLNRDFNVTQLIS